MEPSLLLQIACRTGKQAMRFSIDCELNYEADTETTLILNIEAQRGGRQSILNETLILPEGVAGEAYEVPETGNRYRRLVLPVGSHRIAYSAEVETRLMVGNVANINEVPVAELPFDVIPYLYPSRYCQSDKLGRFAWRQFGDIASGHERVGAICNWIFEHVDYLAGTSDGSTSAYDTFTLCAGVCRDFAHLGITFARALGIPARFVSAYALDLVPPDFHAVFEAYLGGQWYLFDATRRCPIDGIMKIAVGRDAADSAFATYFGQLTGSTKTITVRRLEDAPGPAEWTVDAVSVSAT
jgi:transglutaminase-like putative cysteine protease